MLTVTTHAGNASSHQREQVLFLIGPGGVGIVTPYDNVVLDSSAQSALIHLRRVVERCGGFGRPENLPEKSMQNLSGQLTAAPDSSNAGCRRKPTVGHNHSIRAHGR